MKYFLTFIITLLPLISSAQSTKLLEIDASSFEPVQTDVLSGVAIDKIGTDPSRRPCARIKMHVNRMSKEEINGLSVRTVGGSVVVTKCVVASEGNGLIIELTAKAPTRFYLHHEKYGDSNEVSLNLEGNKEYRLEASLNTTYSVVVHSNVSEAEVYIDGEYKGMTDNGHTLTVKEVFPGKHSIKVSRGSFTNVAQVEINGDNVFFRLDLETGQKRRNVVTFKIEPGGALLKIDGEVYGNVDKQEISASLSEGEHTYIVSADMYHEEEGTIVVGGSGLVKEIKLKPAYGWMQVSDKGDLKGASVYVDGKFLGTAPIKTDKLSSGEHVVRVEQKLYKHLEQKITISDLQTLNFTPVMDPDFATVELRSVSNDGDIYVNGEYKGPSPWTGRLVFGTHNFEVRKVNHSSNSVIKEITPLSERGRIQLPDPTPILGKLNIVSKPSGADVSVDNKYIGRTPLQLDFLVGTHELSIRKEGYHAERRKVEINENGQTKVAVTLSDVMDLSSEGAANCYIVSSSGVYTFPTVIGNSAISVGRVTSAVVLWESFGTNRTPLVGDLISTVTYSDGMITFRTNKTFREGNAVIAAKNAKGKILWSWHIWFTDQPHEQVYYNNAGIMMDRNLGATSATPGEVGTLGLLYQWGRKDPFLGSSSISDEIQAKSTIAWPSPQSSENFSKYTRIGRIAYAIAHPTTFITYNQNNYDWCYTSRQIFNSTKNKRWKKLSGAKSIYDPCPAGWRIHNGGRKGVWAQAKNSSFFERKAEFTHNYSSVFKGMNFSGKLGSESTIWYPASGYIDARTGYLISVGSSGGYWSASPYWCFAYYQGISYNGVVYPASSGCRADAYSVRCIKE